MADPFVAEIRIFTYDFPPEDWAFCDGQIVPISQNTALFSLLGTTYGGNGTTNFALPDLRGRAVMHPGQGPGLSLHSLGETGGADAVPLTTSQIPSHSHLLRASTDDATDDNPGAARVLAVSSKNAFSNGGTTANLAPESVSEVGAGAPHNNMQPYLTLSFCIALMGVFPPRP